MGGRTFQLLFLQAYFAMFDQNTSNTPYPCLTKAVLACLLKQYPTKGDLLLLCDTSCDLHKVALVINR